MGNVQLDKTAMNGLNKFMIEHPDLGSKSRAVDKLLVTADLVQTLTLTVKVLMGENEWLKREIKTNESTGNNEES